MNKSFKGDIIITDPCYIDTVDRKLWDSDNVNVFTGRGLSQFGFTDFIWASTGVGDWSCTAYGIFEAQINLDMDYASNTIEARQSETVHLGDFCADSGLVGVFYLSEVLKFNPQFDYHLNKPWTTTLIKNFDGVIYLDQSEEYYTRLIGTGNLLFKTEL